MEKINVTMDFNEEFRLDAGNKANSKLFLMRKYRINEVVFCDIFRNKKK